MENSFEVKGNEVIHRRVLRAPRELVWDVWTDPAHVKEWFGPEGFTLTNKSMDVKVNGQWAFTMHGMGRDFSNKVEYLEVKKPSLLVYRHGSDDPSFPPFMVYVTFEARGNTTVLTMRSVFASAEVLERLNREVNAIEGGKQTLNRLEKYVEVWGSV